MTLSRLCWNFPLMPALRSVAYLRVWPKQNWNWRLSSSNAKPRRARLPYELIFWSYLAHFSYTTLRDSPPKEQDAGDQSWWWRVINLGGSKYRIGITVLCCSIGYIIIAGSTLFTTRSVQSLTLLRGGEAVRLSCHSPWLSRRDITVPLDSLSCVVSREHVKSYLPMKIKGYRMYFLLDTSGSFTNSKLFDQTAGSFRSWVNK